ncbi:unnamed protein product, partial [Menidia menidia]
YKFRDVAVEELQKIHRLHPGMKPSTGTYTFTDGTQKDLLKLNGVIPVRYEGRSYNFPVQLWLLDSFPFTPPICHLKPTPNMVIREGKHEEPPLSTKTSKDAKDPHELLAFVSKLQIKEGGVRDHEQPPHKVSVVGGGDLGMACVMSILSKCKVDKLVFMDVAESSTKGGTTDLEIFRLPNVEVSRDLSASAGSRVVVVTANAWSSEQSYARVVQTNVDLYRGIIPSLAHLSPNAVMLIASQPVDIMTHVAWRQSGLPPTRVIGAGCNLDSERLAHILDINLNAHQPAWVIGELSDNKIAVMSNIGLSSSATPEIAPGPASTKPLLDRAFELLKNRGQRSWSVSLSVADITNSVLTDKNKAHSVSTLAQGWGGIGAEVFLSLPCVMGANGSTRLAGVTLGPEEDSKLRESVASLSTLMGQLRL